MAYSKKTWKDRITEYPNRRELTHSDSSTELVTVARSEGTISQEGDAFSAQNMNDLEGRIDSEFSAVDQNLQDINDNLSGFKYYPAGTGIVGLIADDSAYTDANGKYVIWGTDTAEQLVEDNPNTYKSVPSEEDCRGEVGADSASPFSKGFEVFHTASGRYGTITRTLKSRPKFACVIVKDTTARSYTTYRDFVNNINYQQKSSGGWGGWNTDTKITFDEQTKVITVVTDSENGDYGCEELYVY
jgi:hypothetical protein